MEMTMKKLLFGILFAPMAFGSNIASADPWPANVVGTWNVQANQSSLIMRILSQGATGNCQAISGTLQDIGSPALAISWASTAYSAVESALCARIPGPT